MIKMYIEENGQLIGEINQTEYQLLQRVLQKESIEDVDYYISSDTIDLLEVRGGDAELIRLLRKAVAESDGGIDITWVHPD
jgi:hypothetical protein